MGDPNDNGPISTSAVEQQQVQMTKILNPSKNDVLCGRGVATNNWKGNTQFRALVSLNKEIYVTSSKKQKMAISRSIVQAVRAMEDPPGRFLEKDPVTGLWSDIGDKKAIEKTSQALRDGAASLRKQLSEDLCDPDFLSAVFDGSDTGATGKNNKEKDKSKQIPIKAKVAIKKGHRRTQSMPDTRLPGHRRSPSITDGPLVQRMVIDSQNKRSNSIIDGQIFSISQSEIESAMGVAPATTRSETSTPVLNGVAASSDQNHPLLRRHNPSPPIQEQEVFSSSDDVFASLRESNEIFDDFLKQNNGKGIGEKSLFPQEPLESEQQNPSGWSSSWNDKQQFAQNSLPPRHRGHSRRGRSHCRSQSVPDWGFAGVLSTSIAEGAHLTGKESFASLTAAAPPAQPQTFAPAPSNVQSFTPTPNNFQAASAEVSASSDQPQVQVSREMGLTEMLASFRKDAAQKAETMQTTPCKPVERMEEIKIDDMLMDDEDLFNDDMLSPLPFEDGKDIQMAFMDLTDDYMPLTSSGPEDKSREIFNF